MPNVCVNIFNFFSILLEVLRKSKNYSSKKAVKSNFSHIRLFSQLHKQNINDMPPSNLGLQKTFSGHSSWTIQKTSFWVKIFFDYLLSREFLRFCTRYSAFFRDCCGDSCPSSSITFLEKDIPLPEISWLGACPHYQLLHSAPGKPLIGYLKKNCSLLSHTNTQISHAHLVKKP